MNTEKIINLTESLSSMKSAKFAKPDISCIGFTTDFNTPATGEVISTLPLREYSFTITEELNAAIKPVLNKYIKIYQEEIKKEIKKEQS